jgi:hypothetical protein
MTNTLQRLLLFFAVMALLPFSSSSVFGAADPAQGCIEVKRSDAWGDPEDSF